MTKLSPHVTKLSHHVTKLNLIKGVSYKNLIFMTKNQDINPYHLNSVQFPCKPYSLPVDGLTTDFFLLQQLLSFSSLLHFFMKCAPFPVHLVEPLLLFSWQLYT